MSITPFYLHNISYMYNIILLFITTLGVDLSEKSDIKAMDWMENSPVLNLIQTFWLFMVAEINKMIKATKIKLKEIIIRA